MIQITGKVAIAESPAVLTAKWECTLQLSSNLLLPDGHNLQSGHHYAMYHNHIEKTHAAPTGNCQQR